MQTEDVPEERASAERRIRPRWDGIAVVSGVCALGLLIVGGFLVGFTTGWDERQGGMSLRQTVLAYPPLLAAGALVIVQIVRRGVTLSERSITTHGLFRPTREFLWSEIDHFEVKCQDVEEGPSFWSIAMVLRNGKGILLPLGPAYAAQRSTERRVAELNRELKARRRESKDREIGRD
jgi:hypothetical protein